MKKQWFNIKTLIWDWNRLSYTVPSLSSKIKIFARILLKHQVVKNTMEENLQNRIHIPVQASGLPGKAHLAMCLASTEYRPEMLLNTLRCTGLKIPGVGEECLLKFHRTQPTQPHVAALWGSLAFKQPNNRATEEDWGTTLSPPPKHWQTIVGGFYLGSHMLFFFSAFFKSYKFPGLYVIQVLYCEIP